MSWAKCNECGGEVWFDAWVDLNGELAGGPYDNTHCETCGGEASYTVVDGDPPDDCDDNEENDCDDNEEEWVMGHTPGPWYCHVHTAVAEESDGEYGTATCITTVDEEEYTRVGHRGDLLAWVPHDRCHDENARLIAAAPELLAACQGVANDCERIINGDDFSGMSDSELFGAFLNALRPAIAKAEGRR